MSDSLEKALVKPRAIEHAPESFDETLVACMPYLLRYAKQLTHGNQTESEDLVQETMRRALEPEGRLGFEIGTNMTAWTRKILLNVYRDAYSSADSRKLARGEEADDAVARAESSVDTERALDMRRTAQRTLKNISKLSTRQRQAIEHTAIGRSEKQTAGRMNIDVGTVKAHVSRARKHLENSPAGKDALEILQSAGSKILNQNIEPEGADKIIES